MTTTTKFPQCLPADQVYGSGFENCQSMMQGCANAIEDAYWNSTSQEERNRLSDFSLYMQNQGMGDWYSNVVVNGKVLGQTFTGGCNALTQDSQQTYGPTLLEAVKEAYEEELHLLQTRSAPSLSPLKPVAFIPGATGPWQPVLSPRWVGDWRP